MAGFEIPFYRHDLGAEELARVAQVLAGPILTTGHEVELFETAFAELLGCRHALGVTSCTGGLHMALLGLGIGAGDEVITTPLSFIATATAIIECGAVPVFADVDPATGLLDPDAAAAAVTPRTRAIMPVHLYGQMCDMRALRALADRHGLAIIEDAAHCVEGRRDGIAPGQLSDAACFSFYATKNLTCGEGGAIAVNDEQLYQRLRLLRLHGMTRTAWDRAREGYQHWDMVALGWKYNMSNIEAALLLPQFGRLGAKLEARRALALRYRALLGGLTGIAMPEMVPDSVHAWHLFTIWAEAMERDGLLHALIAEGIEVVVNYRPIHLTSWFREHLGFAEGAFPRAERIGARTVSLPFYPGMPDGHAERVAATLSRLMG